MNKNKQQQALPEEILQIAKKHKHSYGLVLEPATIDKRDFQLYNITLKRAEGPEDYINFRRGLAYIDQIVEHKHTNFTIAKKGLRKFHDLMPQFLDLKQSYFSNNKHQVAMKNIFLNSILGSKAEKIRIYDTQKLNGENIQISIVYDGFWVIGTKNKTLLLRGLSDISHIKYKHEHLMTIQVAKLFFNHLDTLSEQKVIELKQLLQNYTLIGELLNPKMSQHVVLYQSVQIIFFALVEKSDRINSCKSVKETIDLCKSYGLKHAKYTLKQIKNQQQLILTTLQQIVMEIQQSNIKQRGEGSVLYIEQFSEIQSISKNLFVCKVKTLQYRIFRKLREKLKIYIEKFKKSYQKLLKSYCEEVKELVRQFKTPKPLSYYFQIAERAFQLCQYQTKSVARFISIQFVNFLILCKNKAITKDKFMQIVNNQKFGDYVDEEQKVNSDKLESHQPYNKPECKQQSLKYGLQTKEEQRAVQKNQNIKKKVLILVPMTIPATGKSTLLRAFSQNHKNYPIHHVSSDAIRRQIMEQKMKKTKSLDRAEAYQKSRKQANQKFFNEITNVFRDISKSKENQHVFFIDKNHPQNALKTGISQYTARAKKFANLDIKIVCLLPYCSQQRYMYKKSKFFYPFSAEYILTCLKRVSRRQNHDTLEGTLEQKFNIILNFANMHRNYNLSAYNLGKSFDYVVKFKFFAESPQLSKNALAAEQLLLRILMGSKINADQHHTELPNLMSFVENDWEEQKFSLKQTVQDAYLKIGQIFVRWEALELEEVCFEKKD